jgi:hypothetical protein
VPFWPDEVFVNIVYGTDQHFIMRRSIESRLAASFFICINSSSKALRFFKSSSNKMILGVVDAKVGPQ